LFTPFLWKLGRKVYGKCTRLNGLRDFWRRIALYFRSSCHGTRRDLEQFGGLCLGSLQICRVVCRPVRWHIRHLRRHHCPLAFIQMPALEVQRNNKRNRIAAMNTATMREGPKTE
jgi:hypothetical protein